MNDVAESHPVIVYKNNDKYNDAWYNRNHIKEIGCTLEGIPGIRGKISFSESITRNNYGITDMILHFTISFFGDEGSIGCEFLYSALENSRYWAVANVADNGYTVKEICGESVSIFSRSITIVSNDSDRGSAKDLCKCINTEINDPKWADHIEKFSLIFTGDFIKIK
jgi:hypothetical protein